MASAAQWERRIIGQRTKDALTVKRAQGVRLGRPLEMDEALRERIRELHGTGLGVRAIARQLTDEGVPAVRGGSRWYASSVHGVLDRGY